MKLTDRINEEGGVPLSLSLSLFQDASCEAITFTTRDGAEARRCAERRDVINFDLSCRFCRLRHRGIAQSSATR
jgi:hypothetical protein